MAKKKKGNVENDGEKHPVRLKARDEMRLESRLAKGDRELKRLKAKYRSALGELHELERQNEALVAFSGPAETFKINPKTPAGDSESTAFMIASDWHIEERVDPGVVNGLNRFDLDIACRRAAQFFATDCAWWKSTGRPLLSRRWCWRCWEIFSATTFTRSSRKETSCSRLTRRIRPANC